MIRIILIWLAGSLLLASGASAQQPGYGDTTNARGGRPMTGEMMMNMMDSSDARLDRMVSIMNQTMGGKKVQAMAAVINEMMAQRRMMRRHAKQMMLTAPNAMMGHGTGGGRSMMQNIRPASPDTAHAPAAPDTTGQHRQP
jgi:hypothetical protein